MKEDIEEKKPDNKKVMKSLSPTKVIIPMLIGIGFTVWMFLTDKEFKISDIGGYFANASIFWLFMAVVVLVIRDFFYIYRIRYLTNKQLTWKGSMYSIFLWEFSSAVSPSAVGGTAVASFILTREGIPFGKSLAYVVVSAVLDNAFFIIFGAFVIFGNMAGIYGVDIFPTDEAISKISENIPISASLIKYTFYGSYIGITIYTLLMALGIFVKPSGIKWLFVKITSIRFLKRFQKAAAKQGDELINASKEIKEFSGMYWVRAILSTAIIWIARYFIVNCLIMAINPMSFADNYYILSRHVVLWVIILLAFTPGAAGIAEYAFKAFFGVFALTFASVISVLWRVVTYYPYLIIGVFALPMWMRRVFKEEVSTKEDKENSTET